MIGSSQYRERLLWMVHIPRQVSNWTLTFLVRMGFLFPSYLAQQSIESLHRSSRQLILQRLLSPRHRLQHCLFPILSQLFLLMRQYPRVSYLTQLRRLRSPLQTLPPVDQLLHHWQLLVLHQLRQSPSYLLHSPTYLFQTPFCQM